MAGRIVNITLGTVPAAATAFRLQFSTVPAAPWTAFSRSSASPTVPDTLDVDLLDATVYKLDGLNNPTGNMEAASAAGIWYEAAWQENGIWGNWTVPPFWQEATHAAGYPTAIDLYGFLTGAGLTPAAALMPQLGPAVLAAKQDFEQAIQRRMLADLTITQRRFDPPAKVGSILFIPDAVEITDVHYQPVGWEVSTFNRGIDYELYPDEALATGVQPGESQYRPITGLRFWRRWSLPQSVRTRRGLYVTGRWGYADTLPEQAFRGILARAASALFTQVLIGRTSGILSWKDADRSVTYVDWLKLKMGWDDEAARVVSHYRREHWG